MTRRVMRLMTTLLFFLLLSTSNAIDPSCSSSESDGSDLSIFHIYGGCSPFSQSRPRSSWFNTVLSMATKDPIRLSYLSTLASQKTSVPIASAQQILQTGNYILRVKLGTPGQLMYMVMDTSSDAAWAPCSGCAGCSASVFNFANSSSYAPLDCTTPRCVQVSGQACSSTIGPCFFNQTYGGDSSISATLVQDSLTLGSDVVPGYVFGCINAISGKSIPPQGLLGLGRGPTSLFSQTGPLYKGIFSYCLPSFKSYYFSGSLKLGPVGQPTTIRTTPLLQNPRRPSLYYVNLTGISVGRKLVPAPPELLAFNPSSGAGTIIDSGTVITRFVQPVYDALRDEFRSRVNGTISSLGAFDTCFDTTMNPAPPLVTLHFEGMDMALPVENTLIHSSATPVACLAMAAAPNNVNSVLNVIANLQQQNHRILFDLVNSRVGIARQLCN